MKHIIFAVLLASTPATAQELDTTFTRSPTLHLQWPESQPAPDAIPQSLKIEAASPTLHFTTNLPCMLATVSADAKEVTIDWKCVDDAVAKPADSPLYDNGIRAWAIILKAVHEGTYKDVTPQLLTEPKGVE